MSWDPATLPQIVQAALDATSTAIYEVGRAPTDPHPPTVVGQRPDHVWIDMRPPPRTPELVCDAGALAAWVGTSKPTGRIDRDCPTTTDWPIRVRWWICWSSITDQGSVPIDQRQAAAVRIHATAQAVQRALIAWACQTRYDAVQNLVVGESKPVDPAGGSAGWEWSVTAVT